VIKRLVLPTGLLLAGLALALTGCWDDTVNVEFEDPPTTASLAGRILAWEDGSPVPGAVIEIPGLGRSASADQQGSFLLHGIPPGSHLARVSGPGRLGLTTEAVVPSAAKADLEHWHLDVSVPARCRDLTLTVRDGVDGTLLEGAAVRLYDLELGHELGRVSITPGQAGLSAQTDAGGQAALTGLPPCEVRLEVQAVDSDGDGIIDRAGRMVGLDLRTSALQTAEVGLAAAGQAEAPQVVQSDLSGSSQDAPTVEGRALVVEFSEPMITDPGVTTAELVDDRQLRRPDPIGLQVAWVSETRLEVVARQAVDQTVRVGVLAYGQSGLGVVHHGYVDWSMDGAGEVPCDEPVTGLHVVTGPEDLDYDSNRPVLAFEAVSGATGYLVFARDDAAQTRWLQVHSWSSDWDSGTLEQAVTLPDVFDSDPDDDLQTPLAATTVELTVVPRNATDPAPDSRSEVVSVSDGVAPSLTALAVEGAAVNDGAAATTLDLVVQFSEFLAASTPEPTLTVTEGGGDPAFTLDPAEATWIWSEDRRQGRFRFTLPAGADASDDTCRVIATDLRDLSGNETAGPVTCEPLVLGGSHTFDFEGGADGWTVENLGGSSWELGAPTGVNGPDAASSGTRCWGTDLDADYQDNTDTRLISPELTLNMPSPALTYQGRFDQETCCDRLYLEVSTDGLSWTTIQTSAVQTYAWNTYSHDLSAYAGQTIRIRFRFDSDGSITRPGCFIDDVTVATAAP
jgi:hypothetical protein